MARSRKLKRFAEGTKTSVSDSRGSLETLLRRHDAEQILTGSDCRKEIGFVQFTMARRMFRLKVDYQARVGRAKEVDQREREAWRLLNLIVKAKLEVVRMGESTPEVEFLANVVLPDGTTVEDQVLPALEETYRTGNMPRLLPA
jgi:hypothetical protein